MRVRRRRGGAVAVRARLGTEKLTDAAKPLLTVAEESESEGDEAASQSESELARVQQAADGMGWGLLRQPRYAKVLLVGVMMNVFQQVTRGSSRSPRSHSHSSARSPPSPHFSWLTLLSLTPQVTGINVLVYFAPAILNQVLKSQQGLQRWE
jgi:hypothetical protein